MNDNADDHGRQVKAVMAAVAGLPVAFPRFAPEAVFEGAVKGAAVQMIAVAGLSAGDIAGMFEDLARAFREDEGLIDERPN